MMTKTIKELENELKELNEQGRLLFSSELYKNDKASVKFDGYDKEAKKEMIAKFDAVNFAYEYQSWYTRCVYILRQILLDRVTEFEEC